MEREACVCDHGYERSDLCAEIIIINNAKQFTVLGPTIALVLFYR